MIFTKDDFETFRKINNKLNSIAAIFYSNIFESKIGEANLQSITADKNTFIITYLVHGWQIKDGSLDDWKSQFTFYMYINLDLFNDNDELGKFINREVKKVVNRIELDEN